MAVTELGMTTEVMVLSRKASSKISVTVQSAPLQWIVSGITKSPVGWGVPLVNPIRWLY